MPLELTPEEQEFLTKQTTNQPAEVVIPSAEDFASGAATGADIQVKAPSGIDQDIEQNLQAISSQENTLLDLEKSRAFSEKMAGYYHSIIRGYELEKKSLSGLFEASPWEMSEISEAKNVYHGATSRYFPNGFTTNPFEAREFPEELGQGALASVSQQQKSNINILVAQLPGYQSASNTVVPPATTSPAQAILNTLTQASNNYIAAIDSEITSLATQPYFDDRKPEAIAAASARQVIATQHKAIVISLVATGFKNAGYTNFMAQASTMLSAIDNRVAEISTFLTEGLYEQRRSFALDVCDKGEGCIYKYLQGKASLVALRAKDVQLKRKKKAFESI